jgi:murein L,D-transpeptidase YafK
MAYIITISDKTVKGELAIGDVVAIQDIEPSAKEREVFDIHEIDDTADNLKAKQLSAIPEIKMVWKDGDNYREIIRIPEMRTGFDGSNFYHTLGKDPQNQTIISKDISSVQGIKP